MIELARWLIRVEQTASDVYGRAASSFPGNEKLATFLHQLAMEEKWHRQVMEAALDHFHKHPHQVQAIAVDPETRRRIGWLFSSIDREIASATLSERKILFLVASAEFSEWNDIFLYVVNVLRSQIAGYPKIASGIQSHMRSIQAFLEETEFGPLVLERLRKVPPIWTESILIVEDESPVSELLRAILEDEGTVDIAGDGEGAIGLLAKRFYKLIITDIEMPRMDGIEFFHQATRMYPGIQGRFLFMTGNPTPERRIFFQEKGIPFIAKPAPLAEIRKAARNILLTRAIGEPVAAPMQVVATTGADV